MARHGLASNLVGFSSPSLRVRIEREEPAAGLVFVRTADLRDVGTPLCLRAEQVQAEEPTQVLRHRDGLVSFG